jgi:hypothetical protein
VVGSKEDNRARVNYVVTNIFLVVKTLIFIALKTTSKDTTTIIKN